MSAAFHSKTGSLVTLSNSNKTAQRNHPVQEFNNGVVFSSEPIKDSQLFEVRIDRKVNSWSGSIEIGVSTSDPNSLNFPTSATGFREGTWVMSGSSILKDGHAIIEEYGRDLDQLSEGDRVGVLRTAAGALHFFVNGVDQGPAITGIASRVYAIVDMYGKCAQVTVVDDNNRDIGTVISNEITNEAIAEATFVYSNERLVFHERCGSLVKLSNNRRTAERRRPLDEFNNGVVMTNRPLKDEELFEIRLDRLVDKWSGSIEVGITTHNPATLDFPATMTNMRSGNSAIVSSTSTDITKGTIMMSGCGILTNGKGTRREYGEFNLDELTEGDRIGLTRKANGTLHYYINGMDQGVAASRTPAMVWGVVDLYGMAVKVTIVDRSDPNYPQWESIERRTNNFLRQFRDTYEEEVDDNLEQEKLLFSPRCGSHAAVINGSKTAHRPNATDDFNNGVVITNRILRPNEMFEVRIDRIVDKWAGSIEIGVTTHSPTDLDFPATMTNVRSGTWMMTGNGVMHNGTTVIDEYGLNLDRLRTGDRVASLRKEDGTLHFFINGVDQGCAATNVPANIYGVIDLYGQAAEATIIDHSDFGASTPSETNGDELYFHHLHGRNTTINSNGKTACRPNARGEFNDAIVYSHRPLRDNEIFELTIDRMVDRWSGSIEAGVTCIRPDDLDFPNTMTDIDYGTWMLSGSTIMQDGSTIRNGYALDLDTLTVGSQLGMMRCDDGTLHYFLDGTDQGTACSDVPSGLYAVIDLYGQCAQVTISNPFSDEANSSVANHQNHMVNVTVEPALTEPISTEPTHRFSQCCGKNVAIKNNGCTACRVRSFDHGLVFSADPLRPDELFEVRIDQVSKQWSGSLQIGLTAMVICDDTPPSILPVSAAELRSKNNWLVTGSQVKKNGVVIKENYASSLERLEAGNRVGVRRTSDGSMRIYINGSDMGVAATNIPKNVFAVIDLYGSVEGASITSSIFKDAINSRPPSIHSSTSSESVEADIDQDTAGCVCLEFHGNHGKNVLLSNGNLTASRTASYNQGVVVSHKILPRNHLFQVKIDRMNRRWTSSLMIGVIGFSPEKCSFPVSALCLKKLSWIIQSEAVFHCGVKIKERYGVNLDTLQCGHIVGLLVDDDSALHLYVNGVDQGVAAKDIPSNCHLLLDLYGQCEQVTIVTDERETVSSATDYREKADIEDVVKEKQGPPPVQNVIKNCEYQNICNRFRIMLGLPDGYFSSESNQCFCETCHRIRGDDQYHKRGDPLREYALPFGWCLFTVRVPAKVGLFDKWHVAYHGTKVPAVRRSLDTGDLLISGDMADTGFSLQPPPVCFSEKNIPDDSDHKPVFLSPTIRYAGCEPFAAQYEFKDPKTKKSHQARVAFQVCVKPGSYKIGPQTINLNEPVDPRFSNNELEWSTKERGATILYGLLIKVE